MRDERRWAVRRAFVVCVGVGVLLLGAGCGSRSSTDRGAGDGPGMGGYQAISAAPPPPPRAVSTADSGAIRPRVGASIAAPTPTIGSGGQTGWESAPEAEGPESPPFEGAETPARIALERRFARLDDIQGTHNTDQMVDEYRALYRDVLDEYGPDVYEPYAVLDRLVNVYADLTQKGAEGIRNDLLRPEEVRKWAVSKTLETRREIIRTINDSEVVLWRRMGEAAKHLGLIFMEEGQEKAAEYEINRSWAQLSKHPDAAAYSLSRVLLAQAELAAKQGRWDDAEEASDQQFRLRNRMDARAISSLELQTLELAEGLAAYYLAYTIAQQRAQLPGKAERYAEWNLNAKAYRRETFARQLARLNDSTDGSAVEARERLRTSWGRLAEMAVAPVRGPLTQDALEHRLAEILETGQEAMDLATEAAQVSRDEPGSSAGWVTIEEVRASLPKDTVLIDVIGHLTYDFDAPIREMSWTGTRSLAFIIPPSGRGEVRMVDLGEEQVIRQAIIPYLQNITRPFDVTDRRALRASAQAGAKAAREVGRLLIDPLMPDVAGYDRWVISPYGLSWLFPWSTLIVEDGSMVVERHATSYVFAGRQVLNRPSFVPDAGASTGPAIIMAAPNYDQGLAPKLRGRGPFLPLPQTEEEARGIAPHLEQITGQPPRILLGDDATEGAFRTDSPPSVLVASTHGYYGRLPDTAFGVESPMLNCGLGFAGGNLRRGSASTPGDDGVATGLEILSTNFRGTDLAVLSACETSYGTMQGAQGLIGLNLAFHLAGVNTVLGSLWPVPIEETTALTVGFFEGLAGGTSKDEALRQSQLRLIDRLRSEHGVAHPNLWAGFILTGDALPPRP